ncbi:hypothetical protein ACFL1H_07150 [Nanoarchaeota archaeon]
MITKDKIKFLDDLGGHERKIIKPKSTIVDLLITEFNKLKNLNLIKDVNLVGKHQNIYDILYKTLTEKLNFTDYSNIDLISFIYQSSIMEDDDYDSQLRGIYSGVLLNILSDRNKDFTFYIDGRGIKFKYLFMHANLKETDNLIIDNFNGGDLCNYLVTKNKANLVALINCSGSYLGCEIGSDKSNINYLYLINNNSENIGFQIGKSSIINNLIMINNHGKTIGGLARDGGKIDFLYFNKNISEHGINYGDKPMGKVNCTIYKDNEGQNGFKFNELHLSCDHLYLINKANFDLIEEFKNIYYVNTQYENKVDYSNVKEIKGEEAISSYNKLIKQKNLQNIIKLADNPDQCTGEDFAKYLVKISEEIK